MKCPIDDSELVMSERQNVEIDYCPKCRGVWLDRGELDKIIEKAESETPQQNMQPGQPYQEPNYQPQQYNKHGGKHGGGAYGYKKKRGGFLSELFD